MKPTAATIGKAGEVGVILLMLFNLQSQVGQLRSDMNLVMAAVGVQRVERKPKAGSIDTLSRAKSNGGFSDYVMTGEPHGTTRKKPNKNVCYDRQSNPGQTKGQSSKTAYQRERRNEPDVVAGRF